MAMNRISQIEWKRAFEDVATEYTDKLRLNKQQKTLESACYKLNSHTVTPMFSFALAI